MLFRSPIDLPWGESEGWLQFPLREGWRRPVRHEAEAATRFAGAGTTGALSGLAGGAPQQPVAAAGDAGAGVHPAASRAELISRSLAAESKGPMGRQLGSPVVRALLVANLLIYLLLGTIWALAR